ncbi:MULTISPECIES: M23 family metallopeptidase [Halomonadaceae]|uniref:M23 family metallopeptidase n=1 Tax=Halomonadaceae TaxID=28256 RepID=UPI001597C148|nr:MULTISPECIES: M23 family metallopeptidase [Halomonas]QJQ97211.1 M23 family metallopeptidase [Halomonas sp. PA5]
MLLSGCSSAPSAPQRLEGISGDWVTVQRGDTLGAIATRANVPLERLTRFNPGVDPQRLAVGQRLLVPTQQERAPAGGPYRYQIRPGDTYSAIARRFGTTPQRIQSANPGQSPDRLRVGQVVSVPLGGSAVAASSGSSSSGTSRPAQASAPRPAPAPANLPSSARNWPWPLDDYRVTRQFGPDSRGTLQPMLLTTGSGQQAKAVAEGEVRFAGSMRQLGEVVIIHHEGDLQSVYALCDNVMVEAGQRIRQGTALCRVALSNATERHDLLFDLRQGGKPIDPRRVLR